MEENLLASILRTNEKIQECLNQDMSDIFLGSDLEVGNNYQALNAQQKAKTQPRQSQEQQKENATESNNKTQTQPDDSLLDERYIVSIIGVKQRKSEGTMTKQFYIVYEISITRIVDGVTRSVFRRFKEIRAFYQDLIKADDEIQRNPQVIFPDYTEGWFGSSQVDPESDLVQRRKSDLQAFFFELFRCFPILFHHFRVIEFLDLRSFPAKSYSTYSMHYSKQEDAEVELSEELISDYVYNVKTGRLENTKIPIDPSQKTPSCVEFITYTEKFGKTKQLFNQ